MSENGYAAREEISRRLLVLEHQMWKPFFSKWNNLDLYAGENVICDDIHAPLPYIENVFDAVYCSHVLEHLSTDIGKRLVQDVRRVLKTGGVFRLVVPDLEEICKEYLRQLSACVEDPSEGNMQRYRWMVLELIDQMVREKSGGLMLEVLNSGDFDEEYVKKRTGDELRDFFGDSLHHQVSGDSGLKDESSNTRKTLSARIIEWITDMRREPQPLVPTDFRKTGEVHRWMYDRFSLKILLEESGFAAFSVKSFDDSEIPYWDKYNLDRSLLGHCERKPDSLYVECRKPD